MTVRPSTPVRDIPDFALEEVVARLARPDEHSEWDRLMDEHHYIGRVRDEWSGWSPDQCAAARQLLVGMARFLIRPVLLETFCETPRFQGTCYRAANWIHLGQTQGRGKLDARHQYSQPVKNIFVKPLCPHWQAILNRWLPSPSSRTA